MAIQTWYVREILVATGVNNLFLDRSPDAAVAEAATVTGWIVAKTAAANYSLLSNGTERAATTFSTTIQPATGFNTTVDRSDAVTGESPPNLFTVNSSIGTMYPYVGSFDAGNWTFEFGFRAVTQGGTQDGRIGIRVFKSSVSDPDITNSTELTAAVQLGTVVTNLATAATQFSTVTWSAPAFTLNNEYLWVKCAWEITGQAGNNNADVLFRQGSTCFVNSSNYTPRRYSVT